MILIFFVLNFNLNIRIDGLKKKENIFIVILFIMLGEINKFDVGWLFYW